MELKPDETAWMPVDQPDYLVVYPKTQPLPLTKEMFLLFQAKMLTRLVGEAEQELIDHVNRQLKDNLEAEFLTYLPMGMLNNPKTPSALMFNPAIMETRLADWKAGIREALMQPPAPETETLKAVEMLDLESFQNRLIL